MNLNDAGLPPCPCDYCESRTQSITVGPDGRNVYQECAEDGGCDRLKRWSGSERLAEAMWNVRRHFVGADPDEIEADIDQALEEVRRERQDEE